MYKFWDYVNEEIIKESPNKFKSILKAIFFMGPKNAIIILRVFTTTSNKKGFIYRCINLHAQNKLIKNYGIYIHQNTKIDIGLRLGHPNGIIFGEGTQIGKNTTIYHQVTFGIGSMKSMGDINAYPKVGDNCVIYPGSKIIGDINLGSHTVIGANSVINFSTEENSTYAGYPAKRIK